MPLVNYCKHCAQEVPVGEACPICGGKLTATGERMAFGVYHSPVRDWFCWNDLLRIWVGVLCAVAVIAPLAEGLSGGVQAAAKLIGGGFFGTLLLCLAGLCIICWVILNLRGNDRISYYIDKDGITARVYMENPTKLELLARFTSPSAVKALEAAEEGSAAEGLTLVKKQYLPWKNVSKVRIWRETSCFLFYHPAVWQMITVHCPIQEQEVFETFVRKKMKRNKKAKVYPVMVGKKK